MSAELAQHVRSAVEYADGIRIHIWPCAAGYQANIAEPGTNSWTCHTSGDPIDTLLVALRQFLTRTPERAVVGTPEVEVSREERCVDIAAQLDLEDAIAAAPDYDDLF